MDADKATARARVIASNDDYYVADTERALKPLQEGEPWEVLFLGRYTGNSRAKIAGDPITTKEPFRCWVRDDGSGWVTAGW